jgi:hypothetical protein
MRHIHVEDGLSLRFPGRDEEFNEGVEIGIMAVLMSAGESAFSRWISTANLAQVRTLAEKMGYHVIKGHCEGPSTCVTLRLGPARPKLSLVHSQINPEQKAPA